MQRVLDPRAEYQARMAVHRSAAARCERIHRRLGNWRLAAATAVVVLAWTSFARGMHSRWWVLAPVPVFAALAVAHAGVLRRRALAERAADYHQRGLARLEHRWMGAGESGERYRDPAHPYSEDLDLFGKGSVFQLLCGARTRMGEDMLAAWLLAPAPPEIVLARQAAVAELRPRIDLRESLAVLAGDVRSEVHPEALAAWGEAPPLLPAGWWLRAGHVLLAGMGLAGLVFWFMTGIITPLVVVLLADALLLLGIRKRVDGVIHDVESAAHDLALLAGVMGVLERERFTSPRLAAMRAGLDTEGTPPSRRIARLGRLMELLDSRHHVLMRLIGPLVLWNVHLAYAVEHWRRTSGPAVRNWFTAVAEMEALSSLAGYAFEHPADPFPEFTGESPCFDGAGLAHPLLPADRAVPNPVALGRGQPSVLVVSGSNMSGKSTLLRTLGVNALLAQAGAPVRGERLRLSPVQPAASIRLVDSIHTGASRFYAEITRVRLIVDLTAGPLPVLFLLDEFLHGTNSHDRRLGAESIVRGLVERGAIGLVTTHDLALAEIADNLAPRAANVHFEDRLEAGRLYFDYRLRPGIVRRSNALELMRSVGLEV